MYALLSEEGVVTMANLSSSIVQLVGMTTNTCWRVIRCDTCPTWWALPKMLFAYGINRQTSVCEGSVCVTMKVLEHDSIHPMKTQYMLPMESGSDAK